MCGEGLRPQEIHEILVGQELVERGDDEQQFGLAQPGLLDEELLALAFSPVGVDQALGAGALLALAGVGVALLADEAPLVHQALDRADGDLVELLGFVRFEQFALHFRAVGFGDVHGDAEGDPAADGGIQQALLAGFFQGDVSRRRWYPGCPASSPIWTLV